MEKTFEMIFVGSALDALKGCNDECIFNERLDDIKTAIPNDCAYDEGLLHFCLAELARQLQNDGCLTNLFEFGVLCEVKTVPPCTWGEVYQQVLGTIGNADKSAQMCFLAMIANTNKTRVVETWKRLWCLPSELREKYGDNPTLAHKELRELLRGVSCLSAKERDKLGREAERNLTTFLKEQKNDGNLSEVVFVPVCSSELMKLPPNYARNDTGTWIKFYFGIILHKEERT